MTALIVAFVMLAVAGLVVAARGVVPTRPDLAELLEYHASIDDVDQLSGLDARFNRLNGVLVSLHGANKEEFLANLELVGRTERDHAIEVLKGTVGAAVLLFGFFWLISSAGPLTIILSLLLGQPLGYLLVDSELTRKARHARAEFEETLVSVLSLMAISMEGGSGLNTAVRQTLSLGEGWVIEALTRAVDEAEFLRQGPWTALERLGQRLSIPALVELSATLGLVGTSGAQVSDTLSSRAESSRANLLVQRRAAAESKSASMGVPLGLMTVAWVLFLAYPAVAQLLEL